MSLKVYLGLRCLAQRGLEGRTDACPSLPTDRMDLSIVIPVKNEAGNIAPLLAEIATALDGGGVAYEIVYVDDGSDDTAAELRRLRATNPRLRIVTHAASCLEQSAAIRSGVRAAHGAWVATLDGDGQNDPADLAVQPPKDTRRPHPPSRRC